MNNLIDFLDRLDQELILFLNGLGTPFWDGFWLFIPNKWSAIPLYALLCWLCYKRHSLKQFLVIMVCIALMITLTDQLSNLFKVQFHRLRPCHNPLINGQLRFSRCGGQFGYFSAHAANTFALACFLGNLEFPNDFCKGEPILRIQCRLVFILWITVAYSNCKESMISLIW